MKDNSYICIQAFMRKDLNLKGNALMVYAIIFGFSQDGEGWFMGSKTYIADWLGITTQSVLNVLHELVDKGLIEVRERQINGVVFKDYRAKQSNVEQCRAMQGIGEILPPIKNFDGEGVKNFDEGSKKFLPHNINNNNRNRKNSFIAPSREEVEKYCEEKGYKIDIDYFMEYYATGKNGEWLDSKKEPVKNWKQRVVTWAYRDKPKKTPLKQTVATNKDAWERTADGGFVL